MKVKNRRAIPADPNHLPIDQFHKLGLVLEINRLVLHPLGLALEVEVDIRTGEALGFGGVRDCRNDPEGILFAGFTPDELSKSRAIEAMRQAKVAVRFATGECDARGEQLIRLPDEEAAH